MNWIIYIDGLLIMIALATGTWLLSVKLRDVSIVDSTWSLMFLGAAIAYLMGDMASNIDLRNLIILALISIWAVRLSLYVTWRNMGEKEDHRYQAIREKYSPHFAVKSLFIIFLFQAVLAWIISMPLFATLAYQTAQTNTATQLILDVAAVVLVLVGLFFESTADWQLARFKASPANKGKVMDNGLWRFSRHPNYFGECLIWWGFYLFALSSGAWWSIISPLIMTWLLLKFSGVVMLEETIVNRRPAYRDYIRRTNAFLPGRVKKIDANQQYTEGHA